MKKLFFATTVFACGLALLAGCTKSLNPTGDEPSGNETTATSGRIQLTTEGYKGDTKSSVQDNSVQWVDGDVIMLSSVQWQDEHTMIESSEERTVTVSNGNAYITAGDLLSGTPEVFATYPAGVVIVDYPTWSIHFPSKYDSSIDGNGRQVLALPMMAFADNSANDVTSLEFKHQTAAVKVMLWNNTSSDLTVTRVVVKTDKYMINGGVYLYEHYKDPMHNYDPVETDEYDDPNLRRVDVNFPGYGEVGAMVIPAGDQTKSVQVPFRPIGEDDMTIEIHLTDGTNPYIYRHKAHNPALARNQMMTAKAKLDLNGYMKSAVVNLSTKTDDYEAQDGDFLTGTLGSGYALKIARDATVTLAGMTHHAGKEINGIECLGSATIILAPETVNDLTRGSDDAYFGIIMGQGDDLTLTIDGSGTLNVSGGNGCPGIGGHNLNGFQDLVINGGVITATGGSDAAGIGSGEGSRCGNITFNGGEIVAIGGTSSAAIGCGGNNGRCGDITINEGVTSLKAIKSNVGRSFYIGGKSGQYGTITVDGVPVYNPNRDYEHFNSAISTTTNTNDTWTLTHK